VAQKSFAAVYMVAGLSSRFGGKVKQFSKVGPNGETLIEISMDQAISAGFNKIIFVVGEKTEIPFKEKFGNEYNYKGVKVPVFYAFQVLDLNERDKPWGTCDALVSAKQLINEPFVVCNGDDLYGESSFKKIFDWLSKNNSPVTLGFELGKVLSDAGSVSRAMYSYDKDWNITGLNEILKIERSTLKELGLSEKDLCSMNIFGLVAETIALLEQQLIEFKSTHKGDRKSECYLPTEISNLIKKGKLKVKLLPTQEAWTGITNPDDEERVRQELKAKTI
jgi:dTDP-glucose pyrophosphorylase